MEKGRTTNPHTGVCRDVGSGEQEPPRGPAGLRASSKRAGEATGVRQRPRTGRAPTALPDGNARPRQRGPRRAAARGPRSPEQSPRAPGPATHNKKLMSAAAGAGGARRSLGLRAAAREEEGGRKAEEERRKRGRAGCRTATTCSASLAPGAGGAGGSGQRAA